MKRNVFTQIGGFDEKNFNGWHFYVVDMTLKAHLLNIPCVVVSADIWHRSMGRKDKNWETYENVLREKYKRNFKKIYYPCGHCYTNKLLYKLDKDTVPVQKWFIKKKTIIKIYLRKRIYHLLGKE